ncbi:MAG: hypothetical protein ACOYM7_09345 [Paludibacter sp.]
MTRTILKTVFVGIIIGALAFFMPKLGVGILIISLLMRLFCRCGHGRCCSHHRGSRFQMMDKLRSMSDEEYAEFKNNHGMGCCHFNQKNGTDSTCCSDSKTTETKK